MSNSKPKLMFDLPHNEYAKRLIWKKLGSVDAAAHLTVRDCYDLMLEFAAEEMRLADTYKKLAEDMQAIQLPAPIFIRKEDT